MELTISKFQGIAPRYEPDLKIDSRTGKAWARTAQNIDLSSGKIKALLDNLLQEADTNFYNSLTRYNSAWEKGNNRYFCEWKINNLDLLFYLDGGIIKKKVGASVADLGQTRPEPPTLEILSKDLTDGATYRWIASSHGTNEYYCELIAGGDPSLAEATAVYINSSQAIKGVLGMLAAGEWGYGDNDTLGFSTIYVRLSDGTDPDTKAPNYVVHNGGVLDGDYIYIITTTRSVGGHTDESGPSIESEELTANLNQIRITRPTITDANVTHWNIYRYTVEGGDYQFIVQVAIATTFYDDNIADADVGDAISTWYISDQGNNIVFDKPPGSVDGLITEPHSGMLFFWIGSTLYWTEPGYPDAAPSFYNMNFPANIKKVIPLGGIVAVLTEMGPFRIDGTHPELFQQSKLLGEEPCISSAACKTRSGIAYLCDSGIALFDLTSTSVISDEEFTEKWFESNVSSSGAVMAENDNILYLFHSRGTLVVDVRVSPAIWTTLALIAYAAFKNDLDGKLYIIDSEGIKQIQGATTYLTWSWRSGNILMDTVSPKEFQSIELIGNGTDIVATLYLDGTQKASKTMGFDMEDDRMLKMPEGERGRALQILLSGSGEITELIVRSANE